MAFESIDSTRLKAANKNTYSKKELNDFKVLAGVLVIMFIIITVWGIIGVVFETKVSFLFHLVVQNILFFQYIAFFVLYQLDKPQILESFLGYIFSFLVGKQNIFGKCMEKNYQKDTTFTYNYKVYTNEVFREQEIYIHFITNFGLILLIHLIVLFVTLMVVIAYYVYKKNRIDNRNVETETQVKKRIIIGVLNKIRKVLSTKLIMTMFLSLIVEITIFSFYNFTHTEFNHPLLIFSVYLAFSYLVVTLFFLIKTFLPPVNRHNRNPNDHYNKIHEDYRFLVKGLRLPISKYWTGLQYLFYFIYGIIMVTLYNAPRVSSILNTLLMFFWALYFVGVKPAENLMINVYQIIIHFGLFLADFVIFLLIWFPGMHSGWYRFFDYFASCVIAIILFVNLIMIFFYTVLVWADFSLQDKINQRYMQCRSDVIPEDPFGEDKGSTNTDEEKKKINLLQQSREESNYEKDLKQKVAFFQKEIEKSISSNKDDSDLDIIDVDKVNKVGNKK